MFTEDRTVAVGTKITRLDDDVEPTYSAFISTNPS